MKLLFLTKRFGSGIDSILEDFGRQVRLTENLVKLGHEVHLVAADYVKKQTFEKTLNGAKVSVIPFSFFSFSHYIAKLRKKIQREKYDAIITSSDPVFGAIALMVGRNIPIIYDVQDNYFTYASYRIPLVRMLEKKVLKKAVFVTAVSNPLVHRMKRYSKNVILIGNGMDPNKIKPIDKFVSRKKYKLPMKSKVITYSARYKDKDQKKPIDFLIRSFNLIKKKHKNICLLLIGEGNVSRLKKERDNERIIAFESVKYDVLVEMLSSTDILTIPAVQSPYSEYAAPYKLIEYMAFSKPIVCSDVGEMKNLLSRTSQLIFKQNNTDDFARKIELALKIKKVDYSKQLKRLTWSAITKKLHKEIIKELK
jgi:glycosyltransferase involved in cell wall biosynthesis